MQIENPFIARECAELGVEKNTLKTYLQPQFGQLGEDLILESIVLSACQRHHVPKNHIRYLDVGANHPVQTSNTYIFHKKYGATGVLVEANASIVPVLRQCRPNDTVVNAAVIPSGTNLDTVDLCVSDNSELTSVNADHVKSFGEIGTIQKVVKVGTVKLDELLSKYFPVAPQLMSIDIEGLDLAVLMSCSFRVRPWVIVCEPSRHFMKNSDQLFNVALTSKGYIEVARTEYNIIYIDRNILLESPFRYIIERLRALNHVRVFKRRNKI